MSRFLSANPASNDAKQTASGNIKVIHWPSKTDPLGILKRPLITQFCYHYRQWAKHLDVVMRQHHKAGEKVFVDWAGQTVPIHDPITGEVHEAYLFVAVLRASNYVFAHVFP
jgi:hypothetical protein